MEFRKLHRGVWVRIVLDSATGAYIGELIDFTGARLTEAGSYGEDGAHLKQAVTAHFSR
jgi:hypothetical protein